MIGGFAHEIAEAILASDRDRRRHAIGGATGLRSERREYKFSHETANGNEKPEIVHSTRIEELRIAKHLEKCFANRKSCSFFVQDSGRAEGVDDVRDGLFERLAGKRAKIEGTGRWPQTVRRACESGKSGPARAGCAGVSRGTTRAHAASIAAAGAAGRATITSFIIVA
ncbi:MAG TPA: hypothetical protein VF418_12470 [Sphingomonadaceae bacterium]